MALVDLLTVSRNLFQANLAIVNNTFGNHLIYLQPARQSLRAAMNTAVTASFAADFQPIVASAASVAERLTRLAAAHANQQQAIKTVFTDQVDREDVNLVSLSALQEAFKKVLS